MYLAYLSYVPLFYWVTLALFVGVVFGSFANVVIYRVPLSKSVINPPSACPSCKRRLTVIDLVPVLSWLVLRARCRTCKSKISIRYPLVELACGVLFASMVVFNTSLSVLPLFALAFMLLTITLIDFDTQEIPDGLIIFGAISGAVWVVLGYISPTLFPGSLTWLDALLGMVAGAAPLFIFDRLTILILGKDGFGYGDYKLMAVVGIFLGWQVTLGAFFFAFIAGGIFAAFLMASGRAKRGEYMAFGPFLCAGALASMWLGERLFNLLYGV